MGKISETKECLVCGAPFIRRHGRQKRCEPCLNPPCVECGGPKARGAKDRCFLCERKNRTRKPAPSLSPPPIEEVIAAVEAIGLEESKQFSFGYVIGVVLGDGCVTNDKLRYYRKHAEQNKTSHVFMHRVILQVTSEAFCQKFADEWFSLTGIRKSLWSSTRIYDKPSLPSIKIGHTCKLFHFKCAHKLYGRFLHHIKYKADPRYLLKYPNAVRRGILAGMIDSEGYVSKNRDIVSISQMDRRILDVLAEMLTEMGWKPHIYKPPSQVIYSLVLSTKDVASAWYKVS